MGEMSTMCWARSIVAMIAFCASSTAWAFEMMQALPAEVPVPADNPFTEEKAALGRQLYFDSRLSVNGSVSCNSCHDLAAGGGDHRPVSVGALGKPGTRNAPTLWNVAYQTVLYWDGRARSLEEQIRGHLFDSTTMALPDLAELITRINRIPGYRAQFERVFGEKDAVTLDTLAKAIATYIRTLRTPDSAFDRYIKGDKKALSVEAQRGLATFRDIGCMSCHFGVNFAGPAPGPFLKMGDGFYELFPNYLGSPYDEAYDLTQDIGRVLYSGDPGEKYMWRVPLLRNVALTAPYFHNGSVSTLSEAVRVMGRVELNLTLKDDEVRDIVAFLESLNGVRPPQSLPILPATPHDVVWPWQRPVAEIGAAAAAKTAHPTK